MTQPIKEKIMGITTSKKVAVTGATVDAYVNIANIQISKRKERVQLTERVRGVEAVEAVEGQPEVLAQKAVGTPGEEGYQPAVPHQDAVEAVKGVEAVEAQRATHEMQEFIKCSYTVNMYASRGMKTAFSRKHFEFNYDLDSTDNAYVQSYADLKTQKGFDDAVDAQP